MAQSHGSLHDFPAGPEHGAEARFLAGDEGSALSAWVGAAIAMVGMLVAACALGTAAFLYQRRQKQSSVIKEVSAQKVQVKSNEGGGKKPQAWPDPEVGGEITETVVDKAALVQSDPGSGQLPANVRQELAETLRGILEDEISRGLKASGISDRLDRLEQQAKEHQVLSGSNLPPPGKVQEPKALGDLDSTVKAQAQYDKGYVSDLADTVKREAKSDTRDVSPLRDLASRDAATMTEAEKAETISRRDSGVLGDRKDLTLSPSARQKRYPDPPEKSWMPVDGDRSLRMSLATVQRNLQKRDVQTQELHRQLRATQQDCQGQKLEATYAVKRLQDLLSDPSHAPQAQAQELGNLRRKVEDLSGRLADSRQAEVQWSVVAKRQRAFFMQSERVAQEGVNLFRKHPAGELFLAPPPVYLEDDDEEARTPQNDVGQSHINPYVCDSWPFEPNACAQRCAVEPNLSRWDEEDGIADGSDSEDGSTGSGAERERQQLMLRLPTLPPESPHDDDYEPPERPEDFEPPQPSDEPEPLPALGVLSARSL